MHVLKTISPGGHKDILSIPKAWRSKEILPAFQEAVGGYIETVYIKTLESMMIIDEDGKLKQKDINTKATELAGQPIVGTVVLVPIAIWRSWE